MYFIINNLKLIIGITVATETPYTTLKYKNVNERTDSIIGIFVAAFVIIIILYINLDLFYYISELLEVQNNKGKWRKENEIWRWTRVFTNKFS